MSYVSEDKNYTDPSSSGIDTTISRVGDMTGEPPTNKAVDRDKAAKMAFDHVIGARDAARNNETDSGR